MIKIIRILLLLPHARDRRKPVPDTFINTRHYISIWAPLCLDECRSQLLSEVLTDCGQLNARTSPFLLVNVQTTWKSNNNSNSGWNNNNLHSELTEINDSCQIMIKTQQRGDGSKIQFYPHDICCLVPIEKKDLVENLLRGQRLGGSNNNSSFASQEDMFKHSCIVGHTESSRSGVNGLILKISKRKWAQVGTKEMYLLRIGGNITALREFTALCNVDMIPLNRHLLGQHIDEAKLNSYNNKDPRISSAKAAVDLSDPNHKDTLLKKMGGVEALGKGFTEYARKKFNPSQLMAISASSQGYGEGGFTLIKGPPGTGTSPTSCMQNML